MAGDDSRKAERYVNDTATLEDGFGTLAFGDQLARMTLEVATPFTIGVAGKWGSGKTSVLRRAFATLGGKPVQLALPLGETRKDDGRDNWESWSYNYEKRPIPLSWEKPLHYRAQASLAVWYSPWQHQGSPNPLVPLLLELRAQYEAKLSFLQKAKKKLPPALRRAGLAGLSLLEKATDAGMSLHLRRPVRIADGATEAVRKSWQESREKEYDLADGQRFHLLFEDALEQLLSALLEAGPRGSSLNLNRIGPRLIVFIDDLDRCEESSIIQLLESIKLYLGSQHCVFVLGIDDGAVLDALKRHWSGRADEVNREYLEKLFQAILSIPIPRPQVVQSFVAGRLEVHDFPETVRESCSLMIERLLEPNPRKVKNFVNSLCATWQLFRGSLDRNASGQEAALQRLILFQYLRFFHRPIWRLLERQPWTLHILTKVVTGASHTQVETSFPVTEERPNEQRVLEHFFRSSFAHVLEDMEGERAHPWQPPIERALESFYQRIDRKRSDEWFLTYYRALVTFPSILDDIYLYLPYE